MINRLKTEAEAKKILKPYEELIQKIYYESLYSLNGMLEATTEHVNKRNRSGLLHNFAVNKTKEYLKDDKNVTIVEKYSSVQVIFNLESPLVARYKKVNKKLMSSNVSTKRSNRISNQLSLFPHNITYIDFGYRLDETNTDFEELVVVCRMGNEIIWDYKLVSEINAVKTVTTKSDAEPTLKDEIQIKIKKIR